MRDQDLKYLIVLDGDGASLADRARQNRVAGLLTERSVLHYAARVGAAASLPRLSATTCEVTAQRPHAMPDVTALGGAAAIMTPLDELLHVSLTDPAAKCISILFEKNATHLPVIDHEHLSGIISIRDLLRPFLSTP